jgi:CheY-like chemotaxis protein
MSHRVLLVEDDLALREVTACHLAAAGYVVEAVGDGAAALAAATPDPARRWSCST